MKRTYVLLGAPVPRTSNVDRSPHKKEIVELLTVGWSPDRIHAYLLFQCEQQYGPTFWRDFFREAKKERASLASGTRDERYRTTVECFDRLPGLDFKQLLSANKISLTTDIKTLDPESPAWNRRLE